VNMKTRSSTYYVSLSEHLGFTLSYIISSVCTICLNVGYSSRGLVFREAIFVASRHLCHICHVRAVLSEPLRTR